MLKYPGVDAWRILLVLAFIVAGWIALTPLELPPGQLGDPLASAVVLGVAIAALHWIGPETLAACRMHRLVALFQGLLFLQVGWIVLRLLNHVTMSTDLPLADDGLARLDAAIGFDWLTYFTFVHDRPILLSLLDRSYTSLTTLSTIAFFILLSAADLRRIRFFLEAFFYTAIACIAIGMLFPAEAAVAHYAVDLARFPNFPTPPGLYHMDDLASLRSGAPVMLDLRDLPGLATFPSFHTAAGIVLAASFYRTPGFVPAAAYSAVMIASTPVFGGHYLVDLVGGVAIACLVTRLVAQGSAFSGLFAAPFRRPALAA